MSRDLQIRIIGVGDTFSDHHHPTSFVLGAEGFHLGIDCPDMYRRVLRDAAVTSGSPLDLDAIDDILITHVHGDHMNGLEGAAFFKYFAEKKRLRLYTSADARADIWTHRLQAPMEKLWNGENFRSMTFDEYFDYRPLSWTESNRIGPFEIRTRRTIHHVPTTALLVEYEGKKLGYSADTGFDPGLFEFFADADVIIHETNYGPAHTPYASLAALPPELRARMRLIHYPDTLDLSEPAILPVREGEIIRL